MTDPKSIPIDRARIPEALDAMRAHFSDDRSSDGVGVPPISVDDLAQVHTLADLVNRYDPGEPGKSGAMVFLCRELALAAPTTLTLEDEEELEEIEHDYPFRFHHGDLHVRGSFGAYDNLWITGDLVVEGTIDAGNLDAYPDFVVGGTVRCRALRLCGLTCIGGDVHASRHIEVGQGDHWFLGTLHTPVLIADPDSLDVPLGPGTQTVDADGDAESLAAALGLTLQPGEDEIDLLDRAFVEAGAS